MQNKSSVNINLPQQVIAGMNLDNPKDVEFFGIRKSKTVMFLQAGKVHLFEELQKDYYILLLNKFNKDLPARTYFKKREQELGFKATLNRKVEVYTYYCYGALDHTPDIKNGVLQPAENFRDTLFCPSLQFSGKDITIDGAVLTQRDLTIIDMSARGCLDIEIAAAVGMATSSLDTYKREKLFKKTNTRSKIELINKSYQYQILTPCQELI